MFGGDKHDIACFPANYKAADEEWLSIHHPVRRKESRLSESRGIDIAEVKDRLGAIPAGATDVVVPGENVDSLLSVKAGNPR